MKESKSRNREVKLEVALVILKCFCTYGNGILVVCLKQYKRDWGTPLHMLSVHVLKRENIMIDYDYFISHLPEIITIIAVFVIFLLQTRKKTLTYTVLTNSDVVTGSKEGKSHIQIHHQGKIIPQVRLVEIRIKNSGSLPIKPEDYIEPLRLRLPKSEILSSEVIDIHALGASLETKSSDRSEIVLSKTLLNPADFFDVKVLLADGDADFSVAGRIVGVSKIRNITGREVNYYILLSFVAVNVLALIARLLGWLDYRIIIVLQICTLLVGLWLSFDNRSASQDSET
jgi:hypothetical protein